MFYLGPLEAAAPVPISGLGMVTQPLGGHAAVTRTGVEGYMRIAKDAQCVQSCSGHKDKAFKSVWMPAAHGHLRKAAALQNG